MLGTHIPSVAWEDWSKRTLITKRIDRFIAEVFLNSLLKRGANEAYLWQDVNS